MTRRNPVDPPTITIELGIAQRVFTFSKSLEVLRKDLNVLPIHTHVFREILFSFLSYKVVRTSFK